MCFVYRSYYRCTSAGCGVKKRVERSCEEPTTVVTTYEGQHTHPCPITPRGSLGIISPSHFSTTAPMPHQHHHHHHHGLALFNTSPSLMSTGPMMMSSDFQTNNSINPNPNSNSTNTSFLQDHHQRLNYISNHGNIITASSNNSPSSVSLMMRDHGLLQDIVPRQLSDDH